MMSPFFYFQPTLNRLFKFFFNLYWNYISSARNKKGGQIDPTFPDKTTLKNASFIRVKNSKVEIKIEPEVLFFKLITVSIDECTSLNKRNEENK